VDGYIIWLGLAALIALMIFAALNFALRLPSRARLAEQFENNGRAKDFERFLALRPRYVLATAVLRSVLTLTVLLSVLSYVYAPESEASPVRVLAACLIALLLVLIFGVAIPGAWAKYSGQWLIARMLPLLAVAFVVSYPVVLVLELFDPLVRRLAGVPVRDAQSYADELEREILDVVSEGERHGAVDEEEKEMIESVIELADMRVEEIMMPRTDVVALPKEADLDTVLETICTKGHSRIPVYDGTIDTILGVLYAKDLLRRMDDTPFDITTTMRDAYFIPETKLVRDLLREFQAQKLHIAIVLDEYGGTAGLVTIEDIVEELVGEIADEYETAEQAELKRIDEHTVEVDARMSIDDLNDELKLELPEDEDYETIGGFVFSTMGKIPAVGEQCVHGNVEIQVLAADPRRILRLRLTMSPTAEKAPASAERES